MCILKYLIRENVIYSPITRAQDAGVLGCRFETAVVDQKALGMTAETFSPAM